jgi:glutamine amidotransferase
MFAHLRATTEGSLSDDNCHPFYHGSLMFMHNGGVGGWKHIKRRLAESLADKWYLSVQGGTDSEWCFALFLDTLEQMEHDPSSTPPNGFGPTVLRQAALRTIERTNDLIKNIPPEVIRREKVDTRSLLNFAITDGHSVVCTRYVRSRTDEAASLYYSSGTSWEDKNRNGQFQMNRKDKGADIVLVSSEPLTFERGRKLYSIYIILLTRTETWVTVPTNSTLTIHKQTVMIHPIIDEFYVHNPDHKRDSKLVEDKGLVNTERVAGATCSNVPGGQRAKSNLSSILHESIASTLTPVMHSASPMPSPTPKRENAPNNELRHVNSNLTASARDPNRPQELGNTKKKRKSLSGPDAPEIPQEESETDSSPPRTAYGDPRKMAQYFPELN